MNGRDILDIIDIYTYDEWRREKDMEELLALLNGLELNLNFEKEKHMVSDELLESMDIIAIISELESHYDITIDLETLIPENFENVESILCMVEK